MSKSIVFILSILFIGPAAYAQHQYSTSISLDWYEKTYDNILDDNESILIQTFQGAAFDAHTPEIPRYLHHLPLPGKGLMQVTITPIKTSSIAISQLSTQEKLSTQFEINNEVTQARDDFQGNISVTPVRRTNTGYERLEEFRLSITFTPQTSTSQSRSGNTYTSILSSGTIYKIPVRSSGIYEITGEYLSSELEISDGSVSSSNIQVFTNKGGRLPMAIDTEREDDIVEIPIQVNDGGDGVINSGDNIRFFAEGADKWSFEVEDQKYQHTKNIYDVNNYVFLKIDGSGGKRIESIDSPSTSSYSTNEFDFLQIHEDDRTNLLGAFGSTEGTGKEWYGDYYGLETTMNYEKSFDISNVSQSGAARIKVRLAARGDHTTTTLVRVGGQQFSETAAGTSLSDIEADYAKEVIIDEELTLNDGADIQVEYVKSTPQDEAWLDYIHLEYRKVITSNYPQLRLSDVHSTDHTRAGFEVPTSGFTFWDVTDLHNTRIINPSNGKLNYDVDGKLNTFYMVRNDGYLSPEEGGTPVANQNIHSLERADLIILHHGDFVDAANRLAEHRRNFSGYTVSVIDINLVFNEFSNGRLDPTAIRDFTRMVANRDPEFKYLLLIGDGSYDYRNITPNLLDHNFIPVYETDESLDPINGFPSDDYYVLVSDGEGGNLKGAIDIAVGRLPVTTAEMANAVIDKIIDYDTNKAALGDWRLKVAFAADDEDTNLHVRQANKLADSVELHNPVYNQTKIYFDTYVQESTPGGDRYPAASEAINTSVQNGVLVLNYMGHGGPKGWAQERVLKIPDIETWTNTDQLPILITATCSFTGYDDPAIVSAGEATIQKEDGGVLALLTTVRAVYASENERLAKAVFNTIFEKVDGKAQTLGDIITKAKNRNADSNNILNDRKFSLIGDPSQRIALPLYNIETTAINDEPITTLDTLNALEKVTISGIVTDSNGALVSDFNGEIFPTVYDKKSTIETLQNDSGSRKESFEVYRNILFKGSASVVNGEFSFTFVLPKDINYEFGKGRISYYAHDGDSKDAAGVFHNIIIGGSDPNSVADESGPEMELFMNDENFVFGGSTDNNPILLVNLSDDLGINVSGTSIGHDVVAILDDDNQNTFLLNEFYEANRDDHTSGKVRFQLKDLEPGPHSISVKAWDVSNNSTEERLEFVVINDGDESLRRVYNYPNPFTTSTRFQFEHDLVGSDLEVFVDIYTVSGKLVKTIEQNVYGSGYRVDNIEWDAKDDYGSDLGKGLYLYKIKVLSRELNLIRESDFEKLVIL